MKLIFRKKDAPVEIPQEMGKYLVYFNEKIVYFKIDYFKINYF